MMYCHFTFHQLTESKFTTVNRRTVGHVEKMDDIDIFC